MAREISFVLVTKFYLQVNYSFKINNKLFNFKKYIYLSLSQNRSSLSKPPKVKNIISFRSSLNGIHSRRKKIERVNKTGGAGRGNEEDYVLRSRSINDPPPRTLSVGVSDYVCDLWLSHRRKY